MNEYNDIFGFNTPSGILDDYEPDTLDTLDEAAAALSGIGSQAGDAAATDASEQLYAMAEALQPVVYVARETVRRVRLLTWAVVAIAIVLVLKEMK